MPNHSRSSSPGLARGSTSFSPQDRCMPSKLDDEESGRSRRGESALRNSQFARVWTTRSAGRGMIVRLFEIVSGIEAHANGVVGTALGLDRILRCIADRAQTE